MSDTDSLLELNRPGGQQPGEQRAPGPLDAELGEEMEVGASQAGQAVNQALRALSKAARSFTIYEPNNRAIRRFLQDYRDQMNEALKLVGALDLEVRPFELMHGSEVVYLERDRDRSLAFRLFRDGVRQIYIQQGVPWDDLLCLLEVLSVRFTGFQQQEDDIVTMMWKAGVEHITIRAVEGFEPEDEDRAGSRHHNRKERRRTVARIEAPNDWDLPLPPMPKAGPVRYRPIPNALLNVLHSEEAAAMLPVSAVRLANAMIEVAANATDPTSLQDILPFIGETRDFLLREGNIGPLAMLVRELTRSFAEHVDLVASVLQTFATESAMRQVLRAVPEGTEAPPPELIELIELVPGEHMGLLIDLLASERSRTSGRMAIAILARDAPKRPSLLMSRLDDPEPGVVCDLLRVIGTAMPDRAVDAAEQVIERQEPEVLVALLEMLGVSPEPEKAGALALQLVSAEDADVRRLAAALCARCMVPGAFEKIREQLVLHATRTMKAPEADTLGRAMAQLDPERADEVFTRWIRPKGLLTRFVETPGQKWLRWAAVSGFELIPGEDGEKLLRWLAERAGEELHEHCMATLVRRRSGGRGARG